jgi:phenol hydroxylase P3 protein
MPVHQIYQGNCVTPEANPGAADFNPLAEVLKWYRMEMGRDNLDFEGSQDQKNFKAWRDLAKGN